MNIDLIALTEIDDLDLLFFRLFPTRVTPDQRRNARRAAANGRYGTWLAG